VIQSGYCPDIVPQAMSSKWSKGSSGPAGDEIANLIAHSLRGEGFDASEDGTGRGTPLVPVAINENQQGAVWASDTFQALNKGGGKPGQGYPAVAFTAKDYGRVMPAVAFSIMPMNSGKDYKARETDVAQPIMAGGPVGGNQGGDFVVQSAVRRLTPRECERLQGFPDDWTQVPNRGKPAADGPRYKAIGNSMAVNVMRWIGTRIDWADKVAGGAL
jgi:DNA (cytosine-5)-methyltransferase 1